MSKKFWTIISTAAIVYLLIGLFFTVYYAWYYHWGAFSYFSPGFYSVIFTWPLHVFGFYWDIRSFGWTGKPI